MGFCSVQSSETMQHQAAGKGRNVNQQSAYGAVDKSTNSNEISRSNNNKEEPTALYIRRMMTHPNDPEPYSLSSTNVFSTHSRISVKARGTFYSLNPIKKHRRCDENNTFTTRVMKILDYDTIIRREKKKNRQIRYDRKRRIR